MIREITLDDTKDMCEIYNHYVENTTVSLEDTPLTEEEMSERIKTISEKYLWIVFEEEGKAVGFAYGTVWRKRIGYRNTAETTVYVHKDHAGKGIGKKLYQELIDQLREKKFKTIISIITQPNEKSVKLHEKLGFKKAAMLEKVGYKNDTWIDVGYWQLSFD